MADTITSSTEDAAAPVPEAVTATKGEIVGGSVKAFKSRIARCKSKRRELLREWQINVDMRRGKAADVDTDENRSPVTADWSQTNAKIAQLFSQMPQVIVAGDGPYKPAAYPVQKRLNWRLTKAKVGACMDEVLPDVLNAAGIGVAMVSYEGRSVMKKVPAQRPEDMGPVDQLLIKLKLKQIEYVDQPFVVDRKFSVERVDPADFLWPVEFDRSDFDEAPWIGRSGRAPWAEAKAMFPSENGNRGLTDEDKEKVLGDDRSAQDRLTTDAREDVSKEEDIVCFDEVYYWRYLYHEDEKYFSAIQRMVFVEGISDPVVNEPWKGQKFDDEAGVYLGACKPPIRVLSMHYISSECIPPSESAVTRPTVKELMRGREQMMEQRDHSKPIRWIDSNRADADIITSLMQGDWQGFIPTQGPGDKVIGEVARSNYPQENMEFDRQFKSDLMEARSLGPNQMGVVASGPRSAAESKITQANFTTVISQQRARCTAFMVGIADVLMGLMALYDDFELPDQQEGQELQNWDRTRINQELAFSIRLDSTVLLDSEQRIDRIMRFLNIAGKSGRVKPDSILGELAALSGLDPDEVLAPESPKGPPPPNMSFRFSGAADLMNPLALAMLVEANMAPKPEAMQAAMKMLETVANSTTVPLVIEPKGGSLVPDPGVILRPQGAAPVNAGPQADTPPPPEGEGMQDDRPDWQAVDRINSRRDATQE